jgi:hypothetical protein
MHGADAYFEHKLGIPTQLVNPFESEAIVPSGVCTGAVWMRRGALGNRDGQPRSRRWRWRSRSPEPVDESEPAAAPTVAA